MRPFMTEALEAIATFFDHLNLIKGIEVCFDNFARQLLVIYYYGSNHAQGLVAVCPGEL